MRKLIYIVLVVVCFLSCKDMEVKESLFFLHDNANIGIDFSNNIESTKDFNVYKYRNFYNGGGVALGDINNDGLIDIYFVANQTSNKLYLNKGNFQFEDITEKAGVAGTKAWSTGVTFADVDGDSLLDIYVCNSGDLAGDDKESELFINQGDLTFKESAREFNLNDKGYSTHASFFDYDRDGDLDVYLLNNSYAAIGSFNLRKNERPIRDELGGDKLMRNDGGQFVDVSDEAGIYGSEIGFGLGITVSDFNNDNWPDMFISNDFFERDYLYINNGDGTFKEDLVDQMHSISAASMGADAADINNDGYTDVFVTDMLPYKYERLKTVTTFDDWNRYSYNLKNGYHHQFTRNVLHLNQDGKYFTEVSRLMNVEASDWSWGALFFDMDNDGYRDLFIANGIYKDLTNQDYLEYIANESIIQSIVTDEGVNYKELIDIIPSNMVENMGYLNNKGESFKLDANLGLAAPSFSNGSAFGDLDNDGDLDLVVNNLNMPSFVYENKYGGENNSVQISFKGEGHNTYGIGAKVKVKTSSETRIYENVTCKGFQSTVDHRMTIGLANEGAIDLEIVWPSGKYTIIDSVTAGEQIKVLESEAKSKSLADTNTAGENVFSSTQLLSHISNEKEYSDFNQERLIFWMRNNEGGKIIKGDINGDGTTDVIFPGAKDKPSELWVGNINGGYSHQAEWQLPEDILPEWIDAALSDVDADGDLDLIMASGGVEHSVYSPALIDKIYLNDGQGNYTKSQNIQVLFGKKNSSSVSVLDFDNDGDNDFLVTERMKIGQCGQPCSSQLFENKGSGDFADVTKSKAIGLQGVGMVTASEAVDIDGDGDADILLAGEFMELTCLENHKGNFSKKTLKSNVGLGGLWNTLHCADINGDGDIDILLGNHGKNSRLEATLASPMKLYYGDYDGNGTGEGLLCIMREDGKYYPYSLRHDLIDQMKSLKKKFPDFESFKNATIEDVIGADKIASAVEYTIDNLETTLLINEGDFSFRAVSLPAEAQYTSVYAIEAEDFDKDGDIDIVLGGNLYKVLPELGIIDASRGLYLENKGDLRFVSHMHELNVKGEIRDFEIIDNKLLVTVSNDSLQIFTF